MLQEFVILSNCVSFFAMPHTYRNASSASQVWWCSRFSILDGSMSNRLRPSGENGNANGVGQRLAVIALIGEPKLRSSCAKRGIFIRMGVAHIICISTGWRGGRGGQGRGQSICCQVAKMSVCVFVACACGIFWCIILKASCKESRVGNRKS